MQEGLTPADLALLPLGTLAHALTNDDALRWLEAAGNALRLGGLLVLELAHPADVFDGALVEVRLLMLPENVTVHFLQMSELASQKMRAARGSGNRLAQFLLQPKWCFGCLNATLGMLHDAVRWVGVCLPWRQVAMLGTPIVWYRICVGPNYGCLHSGGWVGTGWREWGRERLEDSIWSANGRFWSIYTGKYLAPTPSHCLQLAQRPSGTHTWTFITKTQHL